MEATLDAIIFDLDGTLADITHRRHFVMGEKKDWESFNHPDNIIKDKPNEAVMKIFKALDHYYNLNADLIIVTGRMEKSRDITERWLYQHDLCAHMLIMRKNDDYRPDHIVKEEILKDLQSQGYNILFTVDDRDSVVDMWRRNGITCLQCARGDF
jgi:phosphoglycolate phosphatase-like HAD superfamily hydrolase